MTDLIGLIRTLADGQVEFIIAGGVAATILGSARTTLDLHVIYRRNDDNMQRLAAALAPLYPRLRGAPAELPFRVDLPTLKRGLNFTLTTDLGPPPR